MRYETAIAALASAAPKHGTLGMEVSHEGHRRHGLERSVRRGHVEMTEVRWRHDTAKHVSIITTTYPVGASRSLSTLHVRMHKRTTIPARAHVIARLCALLRPRKKVITPARPFTALRRERAFLTERRYATRLVPRKVKPPAYDGVFDGTARDPGLFVWGLISTAFMCAVVIVAYLASTGIRL